MLRILKESFKIIGDEKMRYILEFEGDEKIAKIIKEYVKNLKNIESYTVSLKTDVEDFLENEKPTSRAECWCGKTLKYSSEKGYSCPIHGLAHIIPNVLKVDEEADYWGEDIKKMVWSVYVEIVDDCEDKFILKNHTFTIPITRNGCEKINVPVEKIVIGTKPQVKNWLKKYGLKIEDYVK